MTDVSPSSRMPDWAELIGLPWQRDGTGPNAYNCWAFAAMVQRRCFSRPLPALAGFGTPEAARAVVAARRTWHTADAPAHGDMVELRRAGVANHVGVWLDVDHGGVLHCQEGAGVCFDRLSSLELMGWRPSFWTPGPAGRFSTGAQLAGLYISTIGPLLDPTALDEMAAGLQADHGIPLDVRAGDTVAEVLDRAMIRAADVMCFVRPRGASPPAIAADDAEALERALADLGRVAGGALASTVVAADDVLLVVRVPQGGGGGSDPLRIILSIAVIVAAAAAAYFGGLALAGAIWSGVYTPAQLGAVTTAVFSTASLVGNLALNALLPPPSADNDRTGLIGEGSPTYTANAESAVARPGAVIPVCFGRHIHNVDDAAPPWGRYEDNVQYLHQLLCLGVGAHEVHEVRLGETVVWRDGVATENLPGIEVEIVAPDTAVTLFEDGVYTHPDVSGQLLEPEDAIGWYVATPKGIEVSVLEIDIVFGQLVRFTTADVETTVELLVELQTVDAEDAAIGQPVSLETLTFTAASRTSLRSSHRFEVPPGRYQLRVTRLTPAGDDSTFDDAQWTGLKAILPAGRTYGDVQLMALRAEVDAELAAQTARRVAVVKTRKLPILVDGAWQEAVPTRAISAAIGEVCRLHGRLPDLDLAELAALDATWGARGDTCDVVVDEEMSFWTALQGVCRAGRSQPDQIGSRLRIWRDEPRELPCMLFSERNVVRGSLVEQPTLPRSTQPDRLVVPYLDEDTWLVEQVEVGPDGGRQRQESYFGIANRAQLTREIGHDWRASRFRPGLVAFDAEMEGRLLRRGDPIAVTHRQMTTAQSVAVVGCQGFVMTFADALDPEALQPDPVVAIAAPTGRAVWGPVPVVTVAGGDRPNFVVLDADAMAAAVAAAGDPANWLADPGRRTERLRGVIGPSEMIYQRLIVESVGPEREGICTITGIIDDPRAHDADAPLTATGVPQIATLDAGHRVEGAETYVDISVTLLAGETADSLIVEHTVDGGASWVPAIETTDLVVSIEAPTEVTDIRVAPVGRYRGAWVEARVGAVYDAPPAPVELPDGAYVDNNEVALLGAAVRDAVSYEWSLFADGASSAVDVRYTSAPQLQVSASVVSDRGGPWRELRVAVVGTSAAGERSASADVVLTNDAPAAPVILGVNNNHLTWEDGEPDVLGWRVDASWTSAQLTTNVPSIAVPDAAFEVTVRACDAVGDGLPTTYSYSPPPPPPDSN